MGGVMNREDYLEKITSGAGLVQIYTGFVLKGPKIVSQILLNWYYGECFKWSKSSIMFLRLFL